MKQKLKIGFFVALAVLAVVLFSAKLAGSNFEVLNPKGVIATDQKTLIIFATALSLAVVIPVYVMAFVFAVRYRESNTKARYQPDWDHNAKLEAVWWGVPIGLIIVLSIVTWQSTHALDPFKPLVSTKEPLQVQVVALQWKWLFIYPEQQVATVNYLPLPLDRPIAFQITADAPMNSFWIPQLGGQIYAMSGMSTMLHLQASQQGQYNGSSANLSGEGFAGMRFTADVMSEPAFKAWLESSKQSPEWLSADEYKQLAAPSENNPPITYWPVENNLYQSVLKKYVLPTGGYHTGSSEAH